MKAIKSLALGVCISILSASFVVAEESNDNSSTFSENMFGAAAGLAGVVLMSKWASKSPDSFGATFALFTPIAAYDENGYDDTWPMLVFFESLAIYNLEASKNNMPEDELYKNNLEIWGAFIVLGATVKLFSNEHNDLKLSYYLRNDGDYLIVSYQF